MNRSKVALRPRKASRLWGQRAIPAASLIPVLVTGIQPRRVRAVNDSFAERKSPAPRDLGALDSCDKHRNEASLLLRRITETLVAARP
ncbi:hypothetical protein GFL84_32775 [Rhizobium leguminosarum bv. viciae]|nr:hypothetical protein [Rhizobium leguminosarum bv. viciae]